jgi:hypothetical protein
MHFTGLLRALCAIWPPILGPSPTAWERMTPQPNGCAGIGGIYPTKMHNSL